MGPRRSKRNRGTADTKSNLGLEGEAGPSSPEKPAAKKSRFAKPQMSKRSRGGKGRK